MSKLDKGVAVLVVVAAAYFGGHVVAAGIKGNLAVQQSPTTTAVIQEDDPRWNCHTMGNRICGPSTTVDEWPDCGPACHSDKAWREVIAAQERAGSGWVCWAEDNDQMPEGYEVLCRKA